MGNSLNSFGKPVISDTFTPVADMQSIADFAYDFANVRVGTSADRQALPNAKQKPGMLWVETDGEKRVMRTDGAGAWSDILGGAVIPLTYTPGSNWTPQNGFATYLVAKGKTRFLYGTAARGAGGALTGILTIPVEHRPAANTFLPGNVTSGGVAYALQIQSNGVLWVPYGGGTAAAAYPLAGSWEVA